MSFRYFTVAAALLITPHVGAAQIQNQTVRAKLDSIAGSGVAQKRTVGLAAAVVKGNDTLLLKAYGLADVEWEVPLTADAVFEVGSITKQFTAAAVLQLRDAGKLSLDDEITKWLPDFNTRGNKLTIRRLLDHTSGIRGLTEIPEFGTLAINPNFPRDSAFALINRQPFQFPTGSAQVYNNSAYFLLGLIIEKASGKSYEDYLETEIFRPLGMTHSTYCHSEEDVARRAHGYFIQGPRLQRASTNVHTWPFAAGSICSSVGDMVTWLRALHGGKVVSTKSYKEMIAPAKLSDGTATRYGMGLNVGRNVGGQMVIGHGGTINGFRAEALWYPEAEMAVIVLMNTLSNLDPGGVAMALGAEVLPWKEATFGTFTGNAADIVGKYRGPARGQDMVVEVSETPKGLGFSVNGSPPRTLPYVSGLTWQGGNALLTFRRTEKNGHVTELRFDGGGGSYFILKKQ